MSTQTVVLGETTSKRYLNELGELSVIGNGSFGVQGCSTWNDFGLLYNLAQSHMSIDNHGTVFMISYHQHHRAARPACFSTADCPSCPARRTLLQPPPSPHPSQQPQPPSSSEALQTPVSPPLARPAAGTESSIPNCGQAAHCRTGSTRTGAARRRGASTTAPATRR